MTKLFILVIFLGSFTIFAQENADMQLQDLPYGTEFTFKVREIIAKKQSCKKKTIVYSETHKSEVDDYSLVNGQLKCGSPWLENHVYLAVFPAKVDSDEVKCKVRYSNKSHDGAVMISFQKREKGRCPRLFFYPGKKPIADPLTLGNLMYNLGEHVSITLPSKETAESSDENENNSGRAISSKPSSTKEGSDKASETQGAAN